MDARMGHTTDSTAPVPKPKQRRYRATPDQLRELMDLFDQNPSPPAAELAELATRINMPQQSVILWFKNRRARVPHKKNAGASAHGARPSALQQLSHISRDQSGPRLVDAPKDKPPTPTNGHPPTSYTTPYGVAQPFPPTSSVTKEASHRRRDTMASPNMQTTHDAAAALLGFSKAPRARSMSSHAEMDIEQDPRRMPVFSTPPPSDSDRRRIAPSYVVTEDGGAQSGGARSEYTRNNNKTWTERSMRIDDERAEKKLRTEKMTRAVPQIVEVHHRPPVTPRITRQRVYAPGDKIEVLENPDSTTRAWLPGTVIRLANDANDVDLHGGQSSKSVIGGLLSLGASAAELSGKGTTKDESDVMTPVTPSDVNRNAKTPWRDSNTTDSSSEGANSERSMPYAEETTMTRRFVSPRRSLAPSPNMSPTRANSKILYLVEFDRPIVESDSGDDSDAKVARDIVSGSRIRPEPPACSISDEEDAKGDDWRPYVGQAVEVRVGPSWRVAEVRSRVYSKGYQIRREDGTICWTSLGRLRPYRKWKGGDHWTVLTKPPVTLLKQGAGLSHAACNDEEPVMMMMVTSTSSREAADSERLGNADDRPRSPATTDSGPESENTGKRFIRKRRRDDTSGEIDSARVLSRGTRSGASQGPDGLPAGWRCEKVERAAGILGSRVDQFYVAPDGRRHRSLREALRAANLRR